MTSPWATDSRLPRGDHLSDFWIELQTPTWRAFSRHVSGDFPINCLKYLQVGVCNSNHMSGFRVPNSPIPPTTRSSMAIPAPSSSTEAQTAPGAVRRPGASVHTVGPARTISALPGPARVLISLTTDLLTRSPLRTVVPAPSTPQDTESHHRSPRPSSVAPKQSGSPAAGNSAFRRRSIV